MIRQVRITTGARLHFGFLADPHSPSRSCGGLGLMIEQPGYCLTMTRVSEERRGSRAATDRARAAVKSSAHASTSADDLRRISGWIERYQRGAELTLACECQVDRVIPSHRGLGSGTQGGLAVALGLSLISGQRPPAIDKLARLAGRGMRSAIGIHGFERGGLLVDGGKQSPTEIGSLLIREEIPHDWRFLLITPPVVEGYSGEEEQRAFRQLAPMPTSLTERLCRLVLMEIVPAIQENDLPRFANGLAEYGEAVGTYFSPVQGGQFADPRLAKLVGDLKKIGIIGFAQSSWGPTICMPCANEQAALALRDRIKTTGEYASLSFSVVRGLNSGAVVEMTEPE